MMYPWMEIEVSSPNSSQTVTPRRDENSEYTHSDVYYKEVIQMKTDKLTGSKEVSVHTH